LNLQSILLGFLHISHMAAALPYSLAAAVFNHAGITVTELLRYATRNNLTVPLGVLPNYADLTIGGLLATGAHGIWRSGQANMVRLPLLPAATVCNSTDSDVVTSH
jgi:hypothetical protein